MIIYYKVLTTKRQTPIFLYKYEKISNYDENLVGKLVQIPYRNQYIMGIIWQEIFDEKKIFEEEEFKQLKVEKVKFISHIYDIPSILTKNFLQFINVFSKYYMQDLASTAKMIVPIKLRLPEEKLRSRIKTTTEIDFSKFSLKPLSDDQKKIYEDIVNYHNNNQIVLLKGVTGSGKTEIYFHRIANILNEGKQVLLLLPEIGLTMQILDRFEKTFGFKPAMWHSGVTNAKKQSIYEDIVTGREKMIIGARSSLFLPYKNLGLIIIDEEQDSSYKQEDGILYNGRDSAVLRSHYEKIPIILVTATPSIESYKNCLDSKYQMVEVEKRFGQAALPEVIITDMRKEKKSTIISSKLKELMKNALANNMQSLIFLNRKGYAPLILCASCGFRIACKNCSTWLVFHKKNAFLLCHHCGHKESIPDLCPSCNEEGLISFGYGIEKIYEEVEKLFPHAKIAVITKEELSSPEKIEKILKSIENSEVDIIIGTQIITKGYHFPNLNLVGVIDGDMGLTMLDLKANERSFQLLTQVAGRAGREGCEGKVVIQSYDPEHKILKAIAGYKEKEFYEIELEERDNNKLPPYSKIAAILVTSKNDAISRNFASLMVKFAPKNAAVRILGPAPASISKLKNLYRYRIIIIAEKNFPIQNYLYNFTNKVNKPSSVQLKIEIDPYSFY